MNGEVRRSLDPRQCPKVNEPEANLVLLSAFPLFPLYVSSGSPLLPSFSLSLPSHSHFLSLLLLLWIPGCRASLPSLAGLSLCGGLPENCRILGWGVGAGSWARGLGAGAQPRDISQPVLTFIFWEGNLLFKRLLIPLLQKSEILLPEVLEHSLQAQTEILCPMVLLTKQWIKDTQMGWEAGLSLEAEDGSRLRLTRCAWVPGAWGGKAT